MSKLYDLKKWLTLEETARHLSNVFEEEATEADVLRLALDGHLKLSVNFVNHAMAKPGKAIPINEARTVPGIPVEGREPYDVIIGIPLNEHEALEIEDQIVTLTGVWDLPMIGNESLDIEHEYQKLTHGPAVELQNLDGAFVEAGGKIYQLQESFDENEFQCGSRAQLRKIKEYIKTNKFGNVKTEELLNQHKKDRKEFLKQSESQKYFPAGGLPPDSVLIVRKEAIEALKDLQGLKQETVAKGFVKEEGANETKEAKRSVTRSALVTAITPQLRDGVKLESLLSNASKNGLSACKLEKGRNWDFTAVLKYLADNNYLKEEYMHRLGESGLDKSL